jgi:hypothetical protein
LRSSGSTSTRWSPRSRRRTRWRARA